MRDHLKTAVYACTLVAGLFAYWAVSAYYSLADEFSAADLLAFSAYLTTCVIIECALILGLHAIFKTDLPTIALSAIFVILNTLSLNLLLNEGFVTLSPVVVAALVGVGFLIAFVAVQAVVETRAVRRWVSIALAALILSAPISYYSDRPIWGGGTSEHVSSVAFTSKPNVYFVGFESMGAPAVLRKRLGFDTAELPAAFERNQFRVFRNLFTEAAPTMNSLTSLLALDGAYSTRALRMGKSPLFSGRLPSPLLEVFKSNGYRTTTLYDSTYFGKWAGPHVDEYRYNELFSVCSFMEPYETSYAFFGVCRFHAWWQEPRKLPGKHIDFLMQAIDEISQRTEPQFLLAHISPLSHTSKDFTGTPDQMKAFLKRYAKQDAAAAQNLDRIVGHLRTRDPTAVLFVFGDHGAWLSRAISFEEDKQFYIQDRYGVLGGVHPSSACATTFADPIAKTYATVPQIARMIIRCLAGGKDAFDTSYQHPFPEGLPEKYEDYLYE
ncbi:MAG: sulfatase-like hydrolase/transferase [Hyphomicrobiaceae bacterium]